MQTNEPRVTGSELEQHLKAMPAWTARDGWLVRQLETDGWRSTMMVVNAIAFIAEAANHHPDLEVHWGRIVIRLQTHSAGGITAKDVELAAKIEHDIMWQPAGAFPGLAGQPDDWIKR